MKYIFYNHKFFAFTLAEVLITLGIIGVVAAITLPTLISNYQMKSFEVAFKREYSTLQNAIDYAMATDNLSECYVYLTYGSNGGYYTAKTEDCKQLFESLNANLQLKTLNSDINKRYTKRDAVLSGGGKAINTSVSYDSITQYTPYMQKDGSIIFYTNVNITGGPYHRSVIVIDVNGEKGPNKWGYDVFWMNLTKHTSGKILLTDQMASLKEKGGRYPREIMLNEKPSSNNYRWY